MSTPPHLDLIAALLLLLAGTAACLSGSRLGRDAVSPDTTGRCPKCHRDFEGCRCGSERP